MLVENPVKCFPASWTATAKPCDLCMSKSAVLYCDTDTLFMCMSCDLKTHGQTKHQRVWMCQVCEQVPASVTCKADAAALCVTCDRDIHSVNLIARRHERIPVIPFYDSSDLLESIKGDISTVDTMSVDVDIQFPLDIPQVMVRAADMFSDRLFDFGFAIPSHVLLEDEFVDSVTAMSLPHAPTPVQPIQIVDHKSLETLKPYVIDFTPSGTTQMQSHSVSTSSIDAGTVTDESSILETIYPLIKASCNEKRKTFSSLDREARVLRYREKRKNRKFEKKIRYASRKAYAEMRPRVKGRFVKKTELTTELDVDPWFVECGGGGEVEYDVIPAF